MKTLRQIIKEELLFEKRITQVSSSLEISFSFFALLALILYLYEADSESLIR